MVGLLILLVPISFAHTFVDPNSSQHDHAVDANPSTMCTPTDPIDDAPVVIVASAVLLGVLSFAAAVVVATRRKKRRSLKLGLLAIGTVCILFGVVWASMYLEINKQTVKFGWPGSTHEHADFAVVLNNQIVDFSNDYYFTYKGHERSRYVHLHDPDAVVHKHASGVTWQYFFDTLNLTMNDTCLVARGTPLCNATFIRNGIEVPGLLAEEIHEGDRVLFHYGNGSASDYFSQAVGNNSCLHSGTCPERGVVPGCAS